ncbi:acyltransferase, partial [Vibrio alginolyticus]|nr:acyltransferase [Vibrio alginolyticus]
MNFRYDINGLRAIAVIAVVLFHFNPSWVPGGFAGVDVFFVISGFLMTGIIFRGLEKDNFSLFQFYVARANRIIPALAVLCIILLVFGWLYLTPSDYKVLGKHVASSISFLSNIVYWRESGYFDAASHEKWLLHTWSLSVEWQFYILYPVVILALKKFLPLRSLKLLLVFGTTLGFILSVIATNKWPNPSYYLLPTRAWEMMMGGVAYAYPWNLSEKKKRVLEFLGLSLILGSYFFVTSSIPWPGHFAILPVLGAYFIIISNRQNSFITNNFIFQPLGKWSYSIYLWHWPIVVFIYSYGLDEATIAGILLSIFLGGMSSKYIERISFKNYSSWFLFYQVKPLYMVVALIPISLFVYIENGINSPVRELTKS